MYNNKILKYKFKLNTTTDYMKKNIYKSKLNYYKLHNQTGGAAAAAEDPELKFIQTLNGQFNEKELIKIMHRFHNEIFKFKCLCGALDHTECFIEAIKEPIKNLVLESYIDLNVLLKFLDVFKGLRSLKIAWGNVKTYGIPPDFINFLDLEEIDCSNSLVVSISPKLEQLKKLNISGASLRIIRLELLPNLEELNCSNCKELTLIPNLKKLVKLDCSNCKQLLSLPSLPNLEILIMNDNNISNISHLFNKLKELDCSNIYFLDLSELHLLKNIEKLNLSNTGIKQLPAEMPFCKELNISNNYEIEHIPVMPLCEKLNIANCSGIFEFYIYRIRNKDPYENLTTITVSKTNERLINILKTNKQLEIELVE